MPIKAIIVDDDRKSRELIHTFCTEYSDDKIHILDLCNFVDSAIVSIEKNNPDLVFLDIDMPGKNGFDLINNFDLLSFEVVFVTGHANQYTKAIEVSALNYLMKPINPLNIKSIVDRFENKIKIADGVNRIKVLKDNLNSNNKSIVFPNNDGFKVVLVSDIIYCETGNGTGKCKIETMNDTIVITKSLKEIAQLLPETSFLKVSGSAIINKSFIKSFHTKEKKLTLSNGYLITVTEFNKSTLMDALT